MSKAKGSFEISFGKEETIEERDGGAKLTRAPGTQKFTGDISGEGTVDWLMAYRTDGTAQYVGLQRISGKIGKRAGSFVMAARGAFNGKTSSATWTIVEGMGTGALEGIRGRGRFKAGPGPKATYTLDYELK
jgi:hypothetical protein